MGTWKSISRWFNKAEEEPPFLDVGPAPDVDEKVLRTVDLSLQTVWDYVAIKAIATNAKSVPITPSIWNPQTQSMDPISRTDPLFKLVERPNKYMLWDEFLEACIWYLSIFGDVPIHKSIIDGTTVAYFPMRPDKVTVKSTTNQLIAGYDFEQALGRTKTFTPDEVFMIKNFDPLNSVRGMSDNQAARQALLADWHSQRYNVVFFGNNAMPSVVLETEKPLTLTARRRLRASWRSAFAGSSKAHGMAILTAGLKVKNIAPSFQDMQFKDLMHESMTRILASRGVPSGVIGMTSGLTQANLAEQRHLFLVNTLRPMVNMILDRLNFEIFNKVGINLEANFDGVLTSSESVHDYRMEIRGFWRDGLITRNQALLKLGFPALQDERGEELFPISAGSTPPGTGDTLEHRDGRRDTELTDRNSDSEPRLISNDSSATIKSVERWSIPEPEFVTFQKNRS